VNLRAELAQLKIVEDVLREVRDLRPTIIRLAAGTMTSN
jgi:hypothetical protein